MTHVVNMTTTSMAVLIVDDSSADRHLLKFSLEDHPAVQHIGTFQSPTVLIEIDRLRRELPQESVLVLLDLHPMPYSGTEILDQIRISYSKEEVPVVCMSGLNDEDSWISAENAGANSFWAKPMDLDQMHDELTRIVDFFSLHTG